MTPRELTSLAKALGGVIREHVSNAIAGFTNELTELEQRIASIPGGKDGVNGVNGVNGKDGAPGERGADGVNGRDGVNGKDGAPGERGADGVNGKDGRDGANGVNGKDGESGKDGRDGIDGKDGAPGKDGRDGANGVNGKDGESGKDGRNGVDGKDGAPGKDGRDGADGKSVTADELLPLVKAWFDALPKPRDGRDGVDGKSVTIDEVRDLVRGLVGELTETAVAKWALEFERRAQDTLQRAIDRMPMPKDGKDGCDGLSVDDLQFEHDGERTVTFRFVRDGVLRNSFVCEVPAMIYRGIFKEGQQYARGDVVTWAGSSWHCNAGTSEKPGEGSKSWVLMTKRGRDGKDGDKGDQGPAGRDGKDFFPVSKV